MSNLTEFVNFFGEYLSSVIDIIIIGVCVIMFCLVIVTELIKSFNPNVDTSEEAVEYIVTTISEQEKDPVPGEDIFVSPFQCIKDTRVDFLIVPLLGLGIAIWVCTFILPQLKVVFMETVMTYYVPFIPHICVFVSLYIIGSLGIEICVSFVGKSIVLINALVTKYKEIEKEEKKIE